MTLQKDIFTTQEAQPGYRLDKVELLNWGTFHQKSWHIAPSLENALLTGDIGSGKSTIVDALTTLLVPHHRIVFNAAAGANSKERTIRSYILGEYKSVREGTAINAKAVSLRNPKSTYSVLIAQFTNEALGETIALAQVLWIEDGKDKKFFIVSKGKLSLQAHFTQFGDALSQLKKRLKTQSGIEVFDTFKEYSQKFRQYFGMSSEKTLQLFYQTVSMKSVENLTEFVRMQMLNETDAEQQLGELLRNFDNLEQAHRMVVKARNQVAALKPVIDTGKEYERKQQALEKLEGAQQARPFFIANKKVAALGDEVHRTSQKLEAALTEQAECESAIAYKSRQVEEINADYLLQGGNRINDLKAQIGHLTSSSAERKNKWNRYKGELETLNVALPEDSLTFSRLREQLQNRIEALVEQKEALSEQAISLKIALRNLNHDLEEEQAELESLKKRKSQLPRHLIALRAELMATLGLEERDVPFAGELIRVREDEQEWEGAIERVLHGFALSMLVDPQHYKEVSAYINQTDLKNRLVYFKKTEEKGAMTYAIQEQSLLHKIDIKPETAFEDWLEEELERRFDYACVDSMEQFRQANYALTRQGQIKQGKSRHEKDDRRNIKDSRYYVLGWSNERKIKTLENQIEQIKRNVNLKTDELEQLNAKHENCEREISVAKSVLHYESFSEINWQEVEAKLADVNEELNRLQESSNQLATLKNKLETLKTALTTLQNKKEELIKESGKLEDRIQGYHKEKSEMEVLLKSLKPEERALHFPVLDKLAGSEFSLQNANPYQNELDKRLTKKIELRKAESLTANKKMIGHMTVFMRKFQEETIELQANADFLPEMREMYKSLQKDDLPKYEAKFKELLNKGTINDISLFKNKLEQTAELITEKIDLINDSLLGIEYNPGTYIHLIPHEETDREIRDFRTDLKNCLSHTAGTDHFYSEEKYLEVKALLDRLKNETEKRWKNKVIDVRNWYAFGASERNTETQEEVDYYSDSGGKSGGQKEKLAYTVLASALAYQYGIHDEQKQMRSFRFVVIDEAFGRGSDDSTKFGLELFKKMGLQLLVVTPLQKINVIQPYITFVHYVMNTSGQNSEVQTLTKEEFLKQQQAYMAERLYNADNPIL